MFHHAHIYIASKLYGSIDPLLLIGGFLPDLAVTKIIKWDEGLHGEKSDKKFSDYIKTKHQSLINLANGVHAHNILDDFTHIEYITKPGYAFQNNEDVVKLVGQYYGLDEESAKRKAHNFLESAVDILLLNEKPEIQEMLKSAVKNVDQYNLAESLADYFEIDKDKLHEAIVFYFELFTRYDFSKKENWILFWAGLEKLLEMKNIGDQSREKLLDKSIEIVENTYQDFLSYAIKNGSKLIKEI